MLVVGLLCGGVVSGVAIADPSDVNESGKRNENVNSGASADNSGALDKNTGAPAGQRISDGNRAGTDDGPRSTVGVGRGQRVFGPRGIRVASDDGPRSTVGARRGARVFGQRIIRRTSDARPRRAAGSRSERAEESRRDRGGISRGTTRRLTIHIPVPHVPRFDGYGIFEPAGIRRQHRCDRGTDRLRTGGDSAAGAPSGESELHGGRRRTRPGRPRRWWFRQGVRHRPGAVGAPTQVGSQAAEGIAPPIRRAPLPPAAEPPPGIAAARGTPSPRQGYHSYLRTRRPPTWPSWHCRASRD